MKKAILKLRKKEKVEIELEVEKESGDSLFLLFSPFQNFKESKKVQKIIKKLEKKYDSGRGKLVANDYMLEVLRMTCKNEILESDVNDIEMEDFIEIQKEINRQKELVLKESKKNLQNRKERRSSSVGKGTKKMK